MLTLPFTVDQFFAVFARYNESVWPMQIVLYALAVATVGLLYRAGTSASRLIALALSLLWAWMAIAYHFAFFTAINSAAWLFGIAFLGASVWFARMGAVRRELRFRLIGGWRGALGAGLIAFALGIYPALGYMLGHRYPAAPTFGLPCPTTIFTIGLLLFATPPLPRTVFVVPLLWTLVGATAAFQLGVTQDLSLLVAGVIGLAAARWGVPKA